MTHAGFANRIVAATAAVVVAAVAVVVVDFVVAVGPVTAETGSLNV